MLRTLSHLLVLSTLATTVLPAQRPYRPDTATLQRLLVAEDARGLGANGLTPLIDALRSPDTLLRRVAIRGLGRIQRPDLGHLLAPALSDPIAAIRAETANAIAQSLNRVRRLPDDSGQVDVRWAAGTLDAATHTERDPVVIDAIAEALGRLPFGDTATAQGAERSILATQMVSFGTVRGLYWLALNRRSTGGLSSEAVAWLHDGMFRADLAAPARRVAVLTLGLINRLDSAAVSRLSRDRDEQVRRLALAGVRGLSPDYRSVVARAALADSSPIVRIAAIGALRIGSRSPDCAPIVAATRDAHPYVAQMAVDSLGAPCADSVAAVNALRDILDGHNAGIQSWPLRNHAMLALAHLNQLSLHRYADSARWPAQLGIAEAAAVLRDTTVLFRLSHSTDHNVREAAIAGLSRTVQHGADSAYIAALVSPGYQVVRAAALALAGSRNPATLPALLDNLDRMTRERRENSRDPRMEILGRVAELGSATSSARLTPYLVDFDTLVASTAANILTKWSGSVVVAHAVPLAIAVEPLAKTFLMRHVDLVVTMASGATFTARLDTENAPATAARILRLVRDHYYDGHIFQRVEPNFVVQGGGPDGNEYVGDAQFMRDELSARSHLRGTLGISSRGRDTGDAQWFLNLTDNTRLDHEYTVFGQVIAGLDVAERIVEGDVMRSVVRSRLSP